MSEQGQPNDPGGQGGDPERMPTEEEMQAALEEQMRRIRVEDVLLQTAVTLINLAARKLGLGAPPGEDVSEERDLEQAKLAIEGARALIPLCPEEQSEPLRQALSQIQMAFAREAQTGAGPPPAAGDPGAPEAAQAPEDAERAKARSKIWTPPGS